MSNELIPSDYQAFLQSIETRVQQAQVRAVVSVNRELILLYWEIGKRILDQQAREGWGTKVIKRLADDLHARFPHMRGLSPRNLKYMRAFAAAYTDESFVQRVIAQLPWGHQCTLLDQVKDEVQRRWYIERAVEHGWSRPVLAAQIETDLYHRSGKALTNFKGTLPPPQSDLVQEALHDPYIFGFLTTSEETKERDLQASLLRHIQEFLLELGVGFTFVGSNYHVVVGGEDFYLDLLFYHIRLRCFVVIELKSGEFKPEYAGKMNFYLSAVDRQVKYESDNPTIGLILCKTKNTVIAEYALANITSPVGVASYRLTTSLPDELRDKLPEIEELVEGIKDMEDEEE